MPRQADWILSHHREAWTNFKCQVITQFIAAARERIRVRKGEAFNLGVYLVSAPDEQRAELVGQRVSDLVLLVDFLAPMVYHAIVHQTPAWVAQTTSDVNQLAPGKALPVLQADSAEGAEAGADWGHRYRRTSGDRLFATP